MLENHKRKMNPNSIAAGIKNMIPVNKRTKEEQKRICSMGGKASQVKQLEDKEFEKTVRIALAQTNPSSGNTYLQDYVASLINRGVLEADPKIFAELRKTAGQDPVTKTEDITDISAVLLAARRRVGVPHDEDSSD